MDSTVTCSLEDVYWHYVGCAHKDIDCRSFVSLCREGGLIDDTFFKDTDAERIFMQSMPLAKRRLDFARFEEALTRIGEARGQESAEVREILLSALAGSVSAAPPQAPAQRPAAETRHRSKSNGHKKSRKRSGSRHQHRDRKKEAEGDDGQPSPMPSPMHRPGEPQEPGDVIPLDTEDEQDESLQLPSNGWSSKIVRQPPAPHGRAPPQPLGMCSSPCEESGSISTSFPSTPSYPSSPDANQDVMLTPGSSGSHLPVPMQRAARPTSATRRREQLEPLAPLSPSLTPSASPMGGVPPLADMRSPSSGAQGGAAGFSPRPAAGVLPRMQVEPEEAPTSPVSSPSKQAHAPELATSSSCPALRTISEHRMVHAAMEEGEELARGPPTLLSSRRTSLPAACAAAPKLASKPGQAAACSSCPTELPPASPQRGGLICGIGGAVADAEAAPPYLDHPAGRQRQRPQTAGRAEGARNTNERVSKRNVEETFLAFCHGQQTLDSKGFVKLCKRCCLLDQKFTAADARLLFSVAVPVDKMKMDLPFFEKALTMVAQKRGLEQGLVYRMVSWYERPLGERGADAGNSPLAGASGKLDASMGSESDIAAQTWSGEPAPEETGPPHGASPTSATMPAPAPAGLPSAPKEPRMMVRPRAGRNLTRSQSVPCVGTGRRSKRRTEEGADRPQLTALPLGKVRRSPPPEIDVPPLALDTLRSRAPGTESPEPQQVECPEEVGTRRDAHTRESVPPLKVQSSPVASSAAVEMAMSRESLVMRPQFVDAF